MPSLGLNIDDTELATLRRRLADTRWPASWPTRPWDAGTDEAELRRLVNRWHDNFDWRAQESAINALPSHTTVIGGHPIHYLKFNGESSAPVPLILSNGWPSTFLEMVDVARRLSSPSKYVLSRGAEGRCCRLW